ncbi:MAG: hypothetical protein WBZ36_16570 [Candidatus Nitrosopolaris sp.]
MTRVSHRSEKPQKLGDDRRFAIMHVMQIEAAVSKLGPLKYMLSSEYWRTE